MAWEFLKRQSNSISSNIINELDTNTIKVIKDLKTYAFKQAGEVHAAPVVLKANISKLFYNKIIDDENFLKKEEERKNELKKQLHDEETKLETTLQNISQTIGEKETIENEISDLRKQKETIHSGDINSIHNIPPPDKIGYFIGIFILVFLTAYLFLFYTSAIYNSFVYDVKEASRASIFNNKSLTTTIFNPNAIIDAYNKSAFTFLFILTSPMIFFGLGYLIHKFNESKKYHYTALILIFTFLFDAVLAYAIVSEIYEAKYATGIIDKPWEFNMVYHQVNFYIILAAGFVIYIVWGVVLSFVINGHNSMNPTRLALKSINSQIAEYQLKLKELRQSLQAYTDIKLNHETAIKKIKTDLEHEKFNEQNFQHRVAEFMSGWHTWIAQGFPYEKHVRQNEADAAKDEIITLLYSKNMINEHKN